MPPADEKQSVRQRRLKELRGTYPELNDAQFAEDVLGVDPTYYSRLKGGGKKIGDMCRDWETNLGLGVGWFDQEGDSAEPAPPRHRLTPEALRIAEAYDDMDRSGRLKMNDLVAKWQRERAAELNPAKSKKKTGT
jgi:hypothetical protein